MEPEWITINVALDIFITEYRMYCVLFYSVDTMINGNSIFEFAKRSKWLIHG